MGNKLCKKKSDVVDNANITPTTKTSTPLNRIINRLHLRPNSWKSESQLNNQKQVNRPTSNFYVSKENNSLSKSTDWTDVTLEVPSDDTIHLPNPKLSVIFADKDELTTPTPPPRKHKQGIREKIEAVAKTSLQAFQGRKPVDEPLCVKKIVKPTNPDDHNCSLHQHEAKRNELNNEHKNFNKEAKRRKNLSVVSLPNYNELKLTVANFDYDIDKKPEPNRSSNISLPHGGDTKKLSQTASTGKLETCMTRCRSFGSLLPQQFLDKLRVKKITTDIESDDSFGGLEDWDLKIIEHYNPKEASLPRSRKLINKPLPADIESLIVQDFNKPIVPARRSESLLKKINREASESVKRSYPESDGRSVSVTPPPSPNTQTGTTMLSVKAEELPLEENEHSSLMKILEEFSIKDKQQEQQNCLIDKEQFKNSVAIVEKFLTNEQKFNENGVECGKIIQT